MSATLQAARRTGPDRSEPSPRAVTLALAVVEGRRLLCNPLLLVGVELGLYLHTRMVLSGPVPVVPRDEVAIGYAMLPMAGATMLVANWAVLRGRRHATTELCDSLPMASGQRTVAHLLSVAAPVGLAAGAAVADLLLLMLVGGVGTPNHFELLSGPTIVALAGVLGVLLAYLAPNIGVGLVTVVGAAASWYFPWLLFRVTGRVRIWRSFWVFPWFQASGSPADWTRTFAGVWHLAYLAGLIGVAACLALAVSSESHRLKAGTVVAAALALALTMASVRAQATPFSVSHPRRAAKVAGGAPETQKCVTRGGVRYCAWPAYLPWVDSRWKQPVEGVLRRVPATERGQTLTVHQMDHGAVVSCWYSPGPTCPPRAEIVGAFSRGDVHPDFSWPRGTREGEAELLVGASTAAWAMGLPTAPSPDSTTLRICMPREARAMLALWMAAQSTPKAAAWLRARTLGQSSDGRTASGPQGSGLGAPSRLTLGSDVFITEWPWQEAAYAVELLDRPPDEVASVLHPNWQRWSQPGTPTVELAKALGLPAPDAAPPEGATGSQVYGNADCDNGGASHAQS